MIFRQYTPSAILQPYVRHYYLFESDTATAFEDTVFPSGDMEMIFNLGAGVWEAATNNEFLRTPPVEFWGQITQPLAIRSKGRHTMLGVKFFPHSAAYFLKEDISSFNDQVCSLADVIGAPVKLLHAQLLETEEINARIALLEAFLVKQLIYQEKKAGKIDKVANILTAIQTDPTEHHLNLVASRHNITPRYLHKLIYQYTGLSPRSLNRITRFQLSLKLLARNEQPLTAIAYECGYFDQSHFIRDFKTFTGVTPSSYLDSISPVNQLLTQ